MKIGSMPARDQRAVGIAVARQASPGETAAHRDAAPTPTACPHSERAWDLPRIHPYGEVVVGVFADAHHAQAALARLRQAGFGTHQAGVAVCCGPSGQSTDLLSLGNAADGPFDALVELGVCSDAARVYQREFGACRGILAVAARGRVAEVLALLQVAAARRR